MSILADTTHSARRERVPFEAEFSARVAIARTAAGLSVQDLAEAVGVSMVLIYAYESGQRMPRLHGANLLAVALGYTGLGEFLTACVSCMGHRKPDWTCNSCGGNRP